MVFRNKLIAILFFVLFTVSIYTQSNDGKKVFIGEFKPYRGSSEVSIKQELIQKLKSELENNSYSVQLTEGTRDNVIRQAKSENADLYIDGFYSRKPNGNLILYGLVYNPESGTVIDAFTISDSLGEISDIKLPPEEIKVSDASLIQKFISKASARVRFNKSRKQNDENLEEFVSSNSIAEEFSLPIKKQDSGSSAQDVFKLLEDTVVVTATRTKTTIKEAPAAVYVVTKEQIKARGYRTLSEALHDLPGFDFQHTYGIYPELIHQRGLVGENNRTLVYIDGVPDNNINENGALAGTIRFPLKNVERIEVVSGPASALYGANAFNGIINVITKDGKTSPGNHVDFTYGAWEKNMTNPGYSTSFSARGTSGGNDSSAINYSVGGYYYNTQGPNFGGISQLDKPGYNKNDVLYALEKRSCGGACLPDSKSVGYYWSPSYNNSKEDTYNITAKFNKGGFRFQTVNWQYLQGQGIFANGMQQIDTKQMGLETGKFDFRNLARLYGIAADPKNIGPEGFIGTNWDFKSNSVLTGYQHNFTDKLNLDSEVIVRSTQILSSSHESYPNKTDYTAEYKPKDVTTATTYSRPDYAYQTEHRLQYNPTSKWNMIFGLMGRHFVAAKDYGSYERFTYSNYSSYGQTQFKPFDKLSFTVGVRYDDTTTYGSTTNPRFSIVYRPTDDLTLKFLVSTGFREPSSKELFTQTKQRKPNPGLRPELLRTTEVGLGYRFFKKYYVNSQLYHNKISNLIIEVATEDTSTINGITPKNPWNQNQNLGIANIYGAEIETNMQLLNSLSMFINYTYTKGEYDNLPSSLQTSPSTRGRRGDNIYDDLYLDAYKILTTTSASPTGKNSVLHSGPIPNIAPHKFNVGFTFVPITDFSFYLGVKYVDIRRNKATDPINTTPGYTMLKINVRKDNLFYDGLFVQVQINNALNEQFFDPGIRAADGTYYPTMHPLERRNIWITVGREF